MTVLIFLGAIAAGIFTFELVEGLTAQRQITGRLQGITINPSELPERSSGWAAVLTLFFPAYFQPDRRNARRDPVELLRRSGYPFPTTGAFFAAAIRTFTIFLLLGGLAAGLLVSLDAGLLPAVGAAAIFVYLGLRRPYVRLQTLIRKRAVALRSNMLTGLAILQALLSSGISVQESLRRSAAIGGPFCNLLGLLVAQMEVVPFTKAVEVVEAHLPDPDDVEVRLFIRAIREFYNRNRPLLPAVRGLQTAVHREVLETTEGRAALVRQRSGLFGVVAVLGLVITIIAPFLGTFS